MADGKECGKEGITWQARKQRETDGDKLMFL
jgi:hypothetical protein